MYEYELLYIVLLVYFYSLHTPMSTSDSTGSKGIEKSTFIANRLLKKSTKEQVNFTFHLVPSHNFVSSRTVFIFAMRIAVASSTIFSASASESVVETLSLFIRFL